MERGNRGCKEECKEDQQEGRQEAGQEGCEEDGQEDGEEEVGKHPSLAGREKALSFLAALSSAAKVLSGLTYGLTGWGMFRSPAFHLSFKKIRHALKTSVTSIAFKSSDSEARTLTRTPCGAQTRGSLSPNRATVGQPAAAAK